MENERPENFEEDEISLVDYWRVIRKRIKLVGGVFFISVVAALVVSLLMPKMYESTLTILPPQEERGGGFLSALAGSELMRSIPIDPGFSLSGLAPHQDVFVTILESRTMAEDIVTKFDLKDHYETEYAEDAVNVLREDKTSIEVSEEGAISVTVEDTDPVLAADIANFYADNLDSMLSHFNITKAGRKKAFIEKRLKNNMEELEQVEKELVEFQKKHQAIALEKQASSGIEAAAALKGEIIAAQVELQSIKSFATEANPEVIRLKRKIDEMKRQLAEIEYGEGWSLPSVDGNPGESHREIHVPFSHYPKLTLEFANLTRDLKIKETIHTLLTQQLEEAKINEARELPIVQVLDKAPVPKRKSSPKILLNTVIAGFIGIFFGVFIAFFMEYIKNEENASSGSS